LHAEAEWIRPHEAAVEWVRPYEGAPGRM